MYQKMIFNSVTKALLHQAKTLYKR
jgi:hypothetical protein